ncbi:MAG TPA: VOC family protein [Candidatus Limnocylindrales bacterium]|nr:VOC family protein [Candidatus Limnocylindrales bacterium]
MSGSVTHFEIPVDDMARAQAFYRDAFGWQIDTLPEMDYTLVRTTPTDESGRPTEPGAINGGMLPRGEPALHPIVTVTVDNVDSALATIESLGGKTVVGRTPVGAMGFTGYAKDTEGNVIGLWESAA